MAPTIRAILYGTLAVGVLDGLFAVVSVSLRGVGPERVFQAVAAGVLGRASYRGGLATAALGLALHFFIAFAVATVYFVASRRFAALRRHPVVYGMVYGVLVYLVMHNVVIPLSAIVPRPPTLSGFLTGAIGHMFFVGIPAAAFARTPAVAAEASSRRVTALATLAVVLCGVLPLGATTPRDGSHDFDFFFGRWRVLNRRLLKPLQGSTEWTTFGGLQLCVPVLGGLSNYDELRNEQGEAVGLSIHTYNRKTGEWSAVWVSSTDGVMQPPMVGTFSNGQGVFYGRDRHDGRPVRVRYTWTGTATPTPRWEQAYSADDGKTWETNWIMEYTREQVP
jgi:hypothetical protein